MLILLHVYSVDLSAYRDSDIDMSICERGGGGGGVCPTVRVFSQGLK